MKAWSSVSLGLVLTLKWLCTVALADPLECSLPENKGLCDFLGENNGVQKRFLRFGRALAGDGFLRFGRQFYRIGRSSPLEEKRFLRFGRAGLDESLSDLVRAYIMQNGHYKNDILYRKRRSVETPVIPKEDDGADSAEITKRDVNDQPTEKRFMRFGRDGADEKRFMRFGKRFMRFGKSLDDKRFMRFGRDPDKRFMRFGKDGKEDKRFMRFGRDGLEEKRFMRFGRSDVDDELEDSDDDDAAGYDKRFMRFGKRFMRFGRDSDDMELEPEADKRFMRFGKRFMRFGKRSDEEQDDKEKRFMRFGKRFMRFGKRDQTQSKEEKASV